MSGVVFYCVCVKVETYLENLRIVLCPDLTVYLLPVIFLSDP